ncbi:hypothetical protein [Cecembia rubra]|uniref:BNR repeat protein n=1 Tax=Cecembia rubra TaxID=1485585 RepID=A0A2P8DPT9_9BACT|nr:hypothetical protein [Cecembia rubra]PSK99226.1 hypothetical protein CLV48_11712 [Cecembia rubra]
MIFRNNIAIQLYSGLLLLSIGLFSCQEKKGEQTTSINQPIPGPLIQAGESNAFLPYLTNHNGKTYISWVEQSENTNRLFYGQLDQNEVQSIQLITEGNDWFVNWADYPQIQFFQDGSIVAFFLKKSGPGTFSYDIMVTLSNNGKDWTLPKKLHDDGTQTEHGFVSMSPWGENMLITWLDGRNTGGGHNHDHGHHGQMTLRAAVMNSNGEKLEEWLLDDRVCDCCQTGSTISSSGPAVVFRDRSETEIRDIGIINWEGSQWKETKIIHMDLWEIPACPVNGPRIASFGKDLAIAWYTAAQDRPEVKVVFSEDNGNSFGIPIRVGLGKTLGRVDLEIIDNQHAFITWMEEGKILGRRVNKNGKLGSPIEIAKSSEKRSSGFPQMTNTDGQIWLAWTDDSQDLKKIQTASLKLDEVISD